ncbi:MAG: hypothetical protein H8E44_06400 [Planctomycetes bacterium]|nr:hypothetical protein [Planctomycetota bacterium]MBL7039359.1 hypothetical protein [Pirellulaceae bacterium]
MQCPVCGSNKVRRTATAHVQPVKNRRCKHCGTIWRPATPVWLAIVFLLLGTPVFLVGCYPLLDAVNCLSSRVSGLPHRVTWNGDMLPVFAFFWFLGAFCLNHGAAVLRGQAGKLRIVKPPVSNEGKRS